MHDDIGRRTFGVLVPWDPKRFLSDPSYRAERTKHDCRWLYFLLANGLIDSVDYSQARERLAAAFKKANGMGS